MNIEIVNRKKNSDKNIDSNALSKDSNLSPEPGTPTISKQKVYRNQNINQFRALFLKNFALQKKQIGTNLCQIFTPIFCLSFLWLIKLLIEQLLLEDSIKLDLEATFPIPLNMPLDLITNSELSPIFTNNCLKWFYYDYEKENLSPEDINNLSNSNSTGIFDIVLQDYCPSAEEHGGYVPYFVHTDNISGNLYSAIDYLNQNVTFKYGKEIENLDILPDGAYYFYAYNKTNISVKIMVNDISLQEYHRNNGLTKVKLRNPAINRTDTDFDKFIYGKNPGIPIVTANDGFINMLDIITKNYLKQINPKIEIFSSIQYLATKNVASSVAVGLYGALGWALYPLALGLGLPVFMYVIVAEKEEKLREIMKMNGMKMRNYWLVNFLFNFLLYSFQATTFYIFGYFILQMTFFTDNRPEIMISVLALWGVCQINLAFFLQAFLNSARSTTILGYIVTMWFLTLSSMVNTQIFYPPSRLPNFLLLIPHFPFSRIFYLMSVACTNSCCFKSFSSIDDEVKDLIYALIFDSIVYLILGFYLNEVIKQDYGIQKHPLFFLGDRTVNWLRRKKINLEAASLMNPENNDRAEELRVEDSDVREERQKILSIEERNYSKYPLILKDLRKVYHNEENNTHKVAVKSLSMSIAQGEVFGLLGPNGAGKTSLISSMTGLICPDEGNAWISGHDILYNIDKVHQIIGVCPQFDLLWPDLTVSEHLLFYARLKGVLKINENEQVKKVLKQVRLEGAANKKAKQLSGGMRRRLSISIALIGDPKLVVLDEPTTGLDPENRRQIWTILADTQHQRATLLTTHLMEEADVLCDKIAIISEGVLRCIGSQTRLKSTYGKGYQLHINQQKLKDLQRKIKGNSLSNSPEKKNSVLDDITNASVTEGLEDLEDQIKKLKLQNKLIIEQLEKEFPEAQLITSSDGIFQYLIPNEKVRISALFEFFEKTKDELGIIDWGITQTTLTEVFANVVGYNLNEDDN